MVNREQVLSYVEQKGPVLPSQMVGVFKTNTMLLGATLSELAHNKKLFISHAKIGSSPVYFTSNQRQKLEVLYKHLNEKDRRTYDLLKEHKVLREKEQTPLVRVSLSNIKDFSIPLQVELSGQKEIFWKWHLITHNEAVEVIRSILHIVEKKKVVPPLKETPSSLPGVTRNIQKLELKKEPLLQKIEEKQKTTPVLNSKPFEESIVEKQSVLKGPNHKNIGVKTSLLPVDDPFFGQLMEFFEKKGIVVESSTIIRKGKDIECVLSVPSPIGPVCYFCKAKSKKRVNEGDLSSAYLTAEMQKMPSLFMTTGILTKKAYEKLDKELKNMKLITLEE